MGAIERVEHSGLAKRPSLKAGDTVEGTSSVDLTEAIRGVVDVLHRHGANLALQFHFLLEIVDLQAKIHGIEQQQR